MSKKFNKYAVIILTILLGELVSNYVMTFFLKYKSDLHPYKSVAIVMFISVCVFYPAFLFINKYLKRASNKYMSKSARFIGNNLTGRVIGFFLALFLIFMAMAQVLYSRNIIEDLKIWLHLI
jgi:hypothetical protein